MNQIILSLAFLQSLAMGSANPTDDLTRLKGCITNVTNRLTFSLNIPTVLNTSDMIRSIGYQIGASMPNLGCVKSVTPTVSVANLGDTSNTDNNSSSVNTLFRSWNETSSASSGTFEKSYNEYIAQLSDLAEGIASRGRAKYAEFDYPVQRQLSSLTRAVYNFAKCCRNGKFLSTGAIILTWEAKKALTNAQTMWENDWHDLATPPTPNNDRHVQQVKRDSSLGASRVWRSGRSITQ